MRLAPKRYRALTKWILIVSAICFVFHVINKILSFHLVVNSVIYFSNETPVNGNFPSDAFKSQLAKQQSADALKNSRSTTSNPVRRCLPKSHIVFLKTHKCGSSTLQNVFLRYGDNHRLHFVLPRINNYLGHPMRFNRRLILDPEVLRVRYNLTYSILAHHTRFSYKEVKSVMPEDTVYVTVVRDPVRLFESLFVFYDLGKKLLNRDNVTLEEFLIVMTSSTSKENLNSEESNQVMNNQNRTSKSSRTGLSSPSTTSWSLTHLISNLMVGAQLTKSPVDINRRAFGKFGRNQMSFDLGFNSKYFDEPIYAANFARNMDTVFDLVLIAERMDESLILLKELLCWSLDDVIAFKHNPRATNYRSAINNHTKTLIRRLNHADQLLYEHFSIRFEAKVKKFGKLRMERELVELRNRTKFLYSKCVQSEEAMTNLVPRNFFPNEKVLAMRPKEMVSEEVISKLCEQLTLPEMLYTDRLRKRQQANLRNKKMQLEKLQLTRGNLIYN